MDLLLPPELQEGLVVTTDNAPHTLPYLLPHADAVIRESMFGSILSQRMRRTEFSINLYIFQLNDPIQVNLRTEEPSAALTYILQGKACYILPETKKTRMTEGYYYLHYFPAGSHSMQLESGICVIIQIELSSKLLFRMYTAYYGIYEAYNSISDKAPEGLLLNEAWMNPPICDILSKMAYCRLEDDIGEVYQEARMLDLLLLYSDNLTEQDKKTPGNFRFSNTDINAILEAGNKQIQRIDDPLLLKDLAQNSHLHPKKLQAGFQAVYGKSYTELITETRMKEAKRLLKETDKSVSEIAYEIGYCNASAFIRAFKRNEGITPLQYR